MLTLMPQVMTAGYEGLTQEEFFQLLTSHGVEGLVDVRGRPVSRKKGFSKSQLEQAAAENGLHYTLFADLGAPKHVVDDYRLDRDWERFRERFLTHLEKQTDAVTRLAALARQQRCCLMCYEANFNQCHRTLVADAVKRFLPSAYRIEHLTGPLEEEQQ